MLCNFCDGSTWQWFKDHRDKMVWIDCRVCFGSGIHSELGRKPLQTIAFTAKLKKGKNTSK